MVVGAEMGGSAVVCTKVVGSELVGIGVVGTKLIKLTGQTVPPAVTVSGSASNR